MRTYRTTLLSWDLALVVGPLPALAALIAVIFVQSIPTLTILAVAVIAYGGLLAGATEAKKAERAQAAAAPGRRPELELLDTVPLTVGPATISVAGAEGVCPLGFRQGHTWALSQNGRLSSPLCRPAVEALSPALRLAQGNGNGQTVSCRCPLGDREVLLRVGHQN